MKSSFTESSTPAGQLRYLRGDKTSSNISGCRDFIASLKESLTGSNVIIVDLEVGESNECLTNYGVPIEKRALVSHTAEILLSGLMDGGISDYEMVYEDNDEATVLARTVERLSSVYLSGGVIAGHNILGYDIPMIVDRCRIAKIHCPTWLADLSKKSACGNGDRVFDSLHAYSPFSLFPRQGMSLADLSAFWGRKFESFGANFGMLWRMKDARTRHILCNYNLWNLLDSMSLFVMTGAAEFYGARLDGLVEVPETSSCEWQKSEGFPVPAQLKINKWPCNGSSTAVFSWITAPLPTLLENGPSASHGWGRTTSGASKAIYPYTSGRQNPQAVKIVGFIAGGADVEAYMFNPNDELSVISAGLVWLGAQKTTVFVDDLKGARFLAIHRASLFNGVAPSWFMFPCQQKLECVTSLFQNRFITPTSIAKANKWIQSDAKVANAPCFNGQPYDDIEEAARFWLSVVTAAADAR